MSRAFAPMILRDEGCAASFTIAWVSSLAFPGATIHAEAIRLHLRAEFRALPRVDHGNARSQVIADFRDDALSSAMHKRVDRDVRRGEPGCHAIVGGVTKEIDGRANRARELGELIAVGPSPRIFTRKPLTCGSASFAA